MVKSDSVLVPETKIMLLTDARPYYRGHSAIKLSETATLKETAALLWEQHVDALFPTTPPTESNGFAEARSALSQLTPADQAVPLFPLLEAASPRNHDRSALGLARTGAELLRWLAALMARTEQPTAEPVHVVLSRAFSPEDAYAGIIRRLLVLVAYTGLLPTLE